MRKNFNVIIIILLICINILGCGKINNTSNDASNLPSATSLSDNNKSSSFETSYNTDQPNISNITSEPEQADESDKKIRTELISSQKSYSDASRTVKFLGLKEYNKLEGETYTDIPQKGNKYLVLFLSIKNNTSEEDYINYNYLKAKIDGEEIEHTFLINEPKNYPTIFTKIYSGGNIAGFIVWEVSSNWKNFEITYGGWKNTNNVLLKGKFTYKDLSNPIIYNANDYINESPSY